MLRSFERACAVLGVIALAVLAALASQSALAQSASLVPNAMTQFSDANGVPYAGGAVYFYVPGTTTPKSTWLDQNSTTLNSNPVILDSAGRAIIFGSGSYRQVLKDQFGNTIWDQITYQPPVAAANTIMGNNSAKPALAVPLTVAQVQTMLGISAPSTWTLGVVTPSQYGAKCNSDGTAGNGNDDTTSLQNWINDAQLNSYVLYVPPSTKFCRTTAALVISTSVTLRGAYCEPYTIPSYGVGLTAPGTGSMGTGSWFFFDHLGKGIVVQPASNVSTGSLIDGICTKRAQSAPLGATWAPIAADYDIAVTANSELSLHNVMLLNPTRGVYSAGRIDLDHVWGQPLMQGFFADDGSDTSVLHNVRWESFWINNPQYINVYTEKNLTAFTVIGAANVSLSDIRAEYGQYCMYFDASTISATSRFLGTNVSCKQFGDAVVKVTGASSGITWQLSNLRASGVVTNPVYFPNLIDFRGSGSTGMLSNVELENAIGECVYINGADALTISGLTCNAWSSGAAIAVTNSAALVVTGGVNVFSGPAGQFTYNTSAAATVSGNPFLGKYSSATLQPCVVGLEGTTLSVTDAGALTFGGVYAGSGTNDTVLLCTGANWTYH